MTPANPMGATVMNPEVKPLWLKALRSGFFQQGTGQLRQDFAYCCLGVLTSVAVEQGIIDSTHAYGRYGTAIHLHPDVAEWSGVPRDGYIGDNRTGYECLTDVNDNSGYSFAQIADLIEECM